MHDRYGRLALCLSALLLAACASAPAQHDSSASPGRAAIHGKFFADMVAAMAAIGGDNPNPYRQRPAPTK